MAELSPRAAPPKPPAPLAQQRRFHETLMHSQYWPEERLVAHQRSKLEHLLRHARAHTRFYADRLNAVFRSDGSIDWDRWPDIPPLRREDVSTHADDMRPQADHAPLSTQQFQTSGSTGAPIRVLNNLAANLASQAALFRGHRWHGVDWSRDVVVWLGDDPKGVPPDGENLGRWGPAWEPRATGVQLLLNRGCRGAAVIDLARRHHAGYLASRGKPLQEIALEILRRGETMPLDKLLTFGSAVTADEREDCRAAFGAEMAQSYASKEIGLMAFECPHGEHLHTQSEIVLVEIVGDDNRPLPPGETGRVLVTSLFNTAQPMIRYEQGDLAVAGTRCACGRTLPVIERIVGRTNHLFRFPDGSRIAPNLPDGTRLLLGAMYWQIAQTGPLTIEVRYVPAEGSIADEPAFARLVRERIRADAEVRFVRRDDLDRVAGGKFIQFVYEVPEAAWAAPAAAAQGGENAFISPP